MELNTVDELISDIRQGRMVVLLDDDADSHNEGVVMVAAEHCEAKHVTFMARQARGLICLTLTEERCQQLDLPPMVDDAQGEKSNFTFRSKPLRVSIRVFPRRIARAQCRRQLRPMPARGYRATGAYFSVDGYARRRTDSRWPHRGGLRLRASGGLAAGRSHRRYPDPGWHGGRWPCAA